MISFHDLEVTASQYICTDYASIMEGGNSTGETLQCVCGRRSPKPELYFLDSVIVSFVSNDMVESTGFRLFFSFHSYNKLPEQMPDGTWNCSVAFWPKMQKHFPCNLVKNCAGGEDEDVCPYSNPLCSSGYFYFAGSCYLYVEVKGRITWKEASSSCKSRGAHLVSMNDEEEWRHVLSLLDRHGSTDAYTGLQTRVAFMPQM